MQGLATLFVYQTALTCSEHFPSALAAALIYAVTSTLVHTGTYVCSPENFDIFLLPVLALLVLSFDLPAAVAAGALVALLTAYSKMINALYFFPVLFGYGLGGDLHLALAFALFFFLFLVLTMVQYRFSPCYQPFSSIFGNAYRYATQTQDRSRKKRVHFNLAGVRALWKGLLREIPIVPFALLASPLFMGWSTEGQVVVFLGWTAVLIMLIQNKLWAIHLYPSLSMAAVLAGILIGQTMLRPIAFLLFGISLFFFIKPLNIPRGQLSRYFWLEGSGALHYLDAEASLEAAHWIKTHAPDTKRVFCWGMQTQLYTHLELIGPTPIQHFNRETLTLPKRQKQLEDWLRGLPPEFIFFSDPYFRYYPLSILEGLTGREYSPVKIFGEGFFPLFRLTPENAPDWKKRVADTIGLDFRWNDFIDELFRAQTLNSGQIRGILKEMKESGIQSVFVYGTNQDTRFLSELEGNNIRILGTVQSSPSPGSGIMGVHELPWPLESRTGILITAKSYNSTVQIRNTIRGYQPSAKVFTLVDESVMKDWLADETALRPVVVYGLGATGRYMLATAEREQIQNVFYHDQMNRMDSYPFMALEDLIMGQGMLFLGAAPSTNISLYFSLIARGVEDSRITDFSGLFNRSCLPGRMKEQALLDCYEKQDKRN
jgi:hypothetical protein